jgi:hypothetical protein
MKKVLEFWYPKRNQTRVKVGAGGVRGGHGFPHRDLPSCTKRGGSWVEIQTFL